MDDEKNLQKELSGLLFVECYQRIKLGRAMMKQIKRFTMELNIRIQRNNRKRLLFEILINFLKVKSI